MYDVVSFPGVLWRRLFVVGGGVRVGRLCVCCVVFLLLLRSGSGFRRAGVLCLLGG